MEMTRSDLMKWDLKLASVPHSACLQLSNVLEAVLIFFFYQCKVNVCDFGEKLIRLEVQIKPTLFKGKQTNAIWCFGWMGSLFCVQLSLMPTTLCMYDWRNTHTHGLCRSTIFKQLFCLQLFVMHSTVGFYVLCQLSLHTIYVWQLSLLSLSAYFVQLLSKQPDFRLWRQIFNVASVLFDCWKATKMIWQWCKVAVVWMLTCDIVSTDAASASDHKPWIHLSQHFTKVQWSKSHLHKLQFK